MSARYRQEYEEESDEGWSQDLPIASREYSDEDSVDEAIDDTLMEKKIPERRSPPELGLQSEIGFKKCEPTPKDELTPSNVFVSSLRLTAYLIIEGGLPPWDTVFQIFILVMIFGNVIIFILSTVETIRVHSTNILLAFEFLTIVIFMLEFGLRMWCIIEKAKYGKMGPVLGRIAHIFTFGSVIDLVSIVPFWIDLILTIRAHSNTKFYDARVLSALRILRIFRLFKADKYTASLEVIVQVFKSKSRVLGITGVMGMILFLFTSTALYFAQGPVDPELSSIPASFYTAALLLTGQGYWNAAPVTPAGKWVVAISNVFSVAVFAIPAGILASGLEPIGEEVHDKRKQQRNRRNRAIQASKEKAKRRRFVERTIAEATHLAAERTNINLELFTSDEDILQHGEPIQRINRELI